MFASSKFPAVGASYQFTEIPLGTLTETVAKFVSQLKSTLPLLIGASGKTEEKAVIAVLVPDGQPVELSIASA